MPEINLFEFEKVELKEDSSFFKGLENFLQTIWDKRDKNESHYSNGDNKDSTEQRIITFLRNDFIKQQNYVGVINFNGETINFLPKIFNKNDNIEHIHLNILWWLSYTNRYKFPKNLTSISSIKSKNFLELIIWLFASYTEETLSKHLHQSFIEVEEETSYLKGQLVFNDYIKNYISRANWSKFYCRFESFEYDNDLNRIIKYVSILLLNYTKVVETKRALQNIIFILNEVSDIQATIEDCNKVKLNYFQDDLRSILDYCKLFLQNSISYNYKNKLELFAFLIPMEKLFEEFIYGFIKKELKLDVKAQSSGIFLTEDKSYQLKPDLIIIFNGKEYIADTKYKIINLDDEKPVSQSDLYQMVAYAIRHNCENIILFYPKIEKNENNLNKINIIDEFANQTIIIYPCQLDIKYNNINLKNNNLENVFKDTRDKLIDQINQLLEVLESK